MNLMTTPLALYFPARMLVQVLLPRLSLVVAVRMSLRVARQQIMANSAL
jgi:hypothetical protein